jgi:hypothetical protein
MNSGSAHFITSSEKSLSEPGSVGEITDDIESSRLQCQEDSLVMPVR